MFENTFFKFFQNKKKRDFLRFFEVSCQKSKKRRKPYSSFMYTNQITGVRYYKIGYFPKCRLLGAL